MEHNFRKIATLNQGTPYDYNSVMQYHRWDTGVALAFQNVFAGLDPNSSVQPCSPNSRYAFSRNGQPTMVPIPNSNVSFGNAKEMSRYDIARLNTLYKCCKWPQKPHTPVPKSQSRCCLMLAYHFYRERWFRSSGQKIIGLALGVMWKAAKKHKINWTISHPCMKFACDE